MLIFEWGPWGSEISEVLAVPLERRSSSRTFFLGTQEWATRFFYTRAVTIRGLRLFASEPWCCPCRVEWVLTRYNATIHVPVAPEPLLLDDVGGWGLAVAWARREALPAAEGTPALRAEISLQSFSSGLDRSAGIPEIKRLM